MMESSEDLQVFAERRVVEPAATTQNVTVAQHPLVFGENVHSTIETDNRRKKDKVIYYIGSTKYSVIAKVCSSLPNWIQCSDEDDDWDICWTDYAVSPERFFKMRPYQKINHFVGTCAISRKNYLARNMLRMKAYYPKEYKFFPHTWSLPADLADFRSQFTGRRRKTFIIKPDASSQGRGIFLTRNIEDIDPKEHLVAQRYIHKPFLMDGLKFDLRIYVLLSGCNPLRGHDVDLLLRTIDECLCKTIIAIQPSLAHIYGSCKGEDLSNSMCFEVLGIDIMIDHQLTPWLIEVNHSPSFTTDSELDTVVKFRVIRDALVLLGISPEARKRHHAHQRIQAEQRRLCLGPKQTREQRLQERQQLTAEIAIKRTAWEDTHLGGWRRIYPTEERIARYGPLLEAAQEIWQSMTGMCKTKIILNRILEDRRRTAAAQKSDDEQSKARKIVPGVIKKGRDKGVEKRIAKTLGDSTHPPDEKEKTVMECGHGRENLAPPLFNATKTCSKKTAPGSSHFSSQIARDGVAHTKSHNIKIHEEQEVASPGPVRTLRAETHITNDKESCTLSSLASLSRSGSTNFFQTSDRRTHRHCISPLERPSIKTCETAYSETQDGSVAEISQSNSVNKGVFHEESETIVRTSINDSSLTVNSRLLGDSCKAQQSSQKNNDQKAVASSPYENTDKALKSMQKEKVAVKEGCTVLDYSYGSAHTLKTVQSTTNTDAIDSVCNTGRLDIIKEEPFNAANGSSLSSVHAGKGNEASKAASSRISRNLPARKNVYRMLPCATSTSDLRERGHQASPIPGKKDVYFMKVINIGEMPLRPSEPLRPSPAVAQLNVKVMPQRRALDDYGSLGTSRATGRAPIKLNVDIM